MRHFTKFLKEYVIFSQYNIPSTLEQNVVDEKHNHTLMDMTRFMMSRSKLPDFIWGEVLKVAMYILNKVSYKVVPKTQLLLFKG